MPRGTADPEVFVSGIPIVTSNYLHDVATAVMFSSGVLMWLVLSRERTDSGGESLLARAYRPLTVAAVASLVWIVVGGIPRTIYFTRVEWDPAKVPGLVVALGVKHGVMFAAVVLGLRLWRSARRRLAGAPDPAR